MKEFDAVECEQRYSEIKINLTKMQGDVEHIKSRIDNGMSKSINDILIKLTDIVPIVNDNSKWVAHVKGGVVWITVIAVGGGLAGIAFNIIKKVFN